MAYTAKDHTFVVCAYGESPFLEECIRSLLSQEVRTHIIVATSTRNAHIQKIARRFFLPLRVRKEGKAGIAEDWNFALSCAGTALVTLAHQDDIYGKGYTRQILHAVNRCERPIIAFTDYAELRNGETITANRLLRIKRMMLLPLCLKMTWKSRFIRRRILSLGSAICCPSVTVNLEQVKLPLFEGSMKSNIDWQAWEKLSRQQGEFAYVPRPMMKHRIHEASTTSSLLQGEERQQEDLAVYRKFWPEWIARGIERFYRQAEKSNNL